MGWRKSQIAMEYVFFTGVVIMIAIVSLFYIYTEYRSQVWQKEAKSLTDLGRAIQTELYIAADMHDGYIRVLTLPNRTSDYFPYNISNHHYEVTLIGTRVGEIGFPTPVFYGHFVIGVDNYIRKENGIINVTQ